MAKKIPSRLNWWQGGILMSLLLLFTFSIVGADRGIGASTYVPYFAGVMFDLDPNKYEYVAEINDSGSWEALFLIGVLIGAFSMSVVITKTFRITYVPTMWLERKNKSVKSRMWWSFFAGFFMIIGARMAGGCTSGHFLSGMSQVAVSSMIFGGVVMATLIITGKLFYKKDSCSTTQDEG